MSEKYKYLRGLNMLFKKLLNSVCLALVIVSLSKSIYETKAYSLQDDVVLEVIGESYESIFNKEKDGLWAPGDTKTNSFIVYNNSSNDIKLERVAFENNINYEGNDDKNILVKNSSIKITDESGKVLYTGSLENLFNKYEMINDDVRIPSGESKKLNMTININENLGNEAQDIYENLKFLINYSNLNRYTNKNSRINKDLPRTGSKISSNLLLGIGELLLFEGIFILKRKKTQA